jgi:hypothetical protein
LEEGDAQKASREIREMVAGLVDVYGMRRRLATDFPRILK